jgi:hypothetical protein
MGQKKKYTHAHMIYRLVIFCCLHTKLKENVYNYNIDNNINNIIIIIIIIIILALA